MPQPITAEQQTAAETLLATIQSAIQLAVDTLQPIQIFRVTNGISRSIFEGVLGDEPVFAPLKSLVVANCNALDVASAQVEDITANAAE